MGASNSRSHNTSLAEKQNNELTNSKNRGSWLSKKKEFSRKSSHSLKDTTSRQVSDNEESNALLGRQRQTNKENVRPSNTGSEVHEEGILRDKLIGLELQMKVRDASVVISDVAANETEFGDTRGTTYKSVEVQHKTSGDHPQASGAIRKEHLCNSDEISCAASVLQDQWYVGQAAPDIVKSHSGKSSDNFRSDTERYHSELEHKNSSPPKLVFTPASPTGDVGNDFKELRSDGLEISSDAVLLNPHDCKEISTGVTRRRVTSFNHGDLPKKKPIAKRSSSDAHARQYTVDGASSSNADALRSGFGGTTEDNARSGSSRPRRYSSSSLCSNNSWLLNTDDNLFVRGWSTRSKPRPAVARSNTAHYGSFALRNFRHKNASSNESSLERKKKGNANERRSVNRRRDRAGSGSSSSRTKSIRRRDNRHSFNLERRYSHLRRNKTQRSSSLSTKSTAFTFSEAYQGTREPEELMESEERLKTQKNATSKEEEVESMSLGGRSSSGE